MAKNYYTYTDDFSNVYSFLQDDAIATAIGNGAAGSPQPRIARARHFFRPRKTTVKLTSGKYAQYVNGNQLMGGLAVGTDVGIGKVVGYVDEKHSSTAAAI